LISEELKNHKFIVLGAEHYNPLGIVRSLGEEGITPIVVTRNSKLKVTSSSRYCGEIYHVNSNEEGYDLIVKKFAGVGIEQKPFVLASDDPTTSFFDQRYEDAKDKFIFYNAGKQGRITEIMEKQRLCDLAKKHGLSIPQTFKVRTGEVPAGLDYPVLTKADDSFAGNWKAATHICQNEEELRKAFEEIRQERVLIQKYIRKKNELCLDGFSWNGGKNVFIAIASNYKYVLPDRYSYYMDVFNFHNEKLQKALEGMFSEIGFEGIFSIEFLVDQNDNLYFLEINFRNSTWSYAATKAGMNLVTGWCSAMLEGEKYKPIYREVPAGFTAMVEISDFKTRVAGRKCGIGQWIKDVKNCNCTFYYDKNDKKPLRTAIFSKLF
jgi:D-aspartate ligase